MVEKRSNKQILLDLEEKHNLLANEVKEYHKTQERIYISVFGIPGTQNGGFVGSFNIARDAIRDLQTDMAVVQDRLKPSRKKQVGFLGTIGTAIVGITYGLGSRLGWW